MTLALDSVIKHDGGSRRAWAIGIASLSAAITIPGLLAVVGFDSAPGHVSGPPVSWPRGTVVPVPDGRARLLMFIHPLCGCTRASLAELESIKSLQYPAGPDVAFILYRPTDRADWVWTQQDETLRSFPAAKIIWDRNGAEAKRFGVLTSGSVLLYNAVGELLFHGGITGSRGHEGSNYGLSMLTDILRKPASRTARSSREFGCALQSEEVE